jgi:hypothetical protein
MTTTRLEQAIDQLRKCSPAESGSADSSQKASSAPRSWPCCPRPSCSAAAPSTQALCSFPRPRSPSPDPSAPGTPDP